MQYNEFIKNDIETKSNSRIKSGVLISYVSIVINIVAGLLYTPWILKEIGDSNYGIYTVATTFISMFMVDFGLSAAVSRFVARYTATNDSEGINNFLGIVYKLYLLVSGMISVVLLILYFNLDIIYSNLLPGELTAFKVVYVICAMSTVFCFPFVTQHGIIRSYEYFFELKLFEMLNRILVIITTIIVLSLNWGLYALVSVNAFYNIVFVFVRFIFIKRNTSIKINWKYKDKALAKNIFSFSLWSTVMSIAEHLTLNIMPSIITAVSDSVAAAHFSLARTIEGYIWSISNAVSGMFLPKVTRKIVGNNEPDEMLSLMVKVGRIILSIVGIVIFGIIILGKNFVLVWLHSAEYSDVYYLMILIIIHNLISAPQQIAATAVIAINKVRNQATIDITCSILNIISAPVLIKHFGVIGAALSIMIVYFLKICFSDIMYYKVLKINIFKFFWLCHIKMLPGFLVSICLSVFINSFIDFGSNIYNLLCHGVIYVIVYLISMWLFSWNKEEKNLILSVIKLKKSEA